MASKVERNAAWKPAEYTDAEAAAIQALGAGVATSIQQKLAINWIITKCARTYDLSYRPGIEGERDTVFAEGARSVGLQLVKLLKIKIGLLRRET